jgi:3-deoxy-D-manno-octulosonate 8-phosphate phosphatase KdsC-like HAD superfamily phosphatase
VTELQPLLRRVRLAVFDFDGVFTDYRVWVNKAGDDLLSLVGRLAGPREFA